METNKLKATTDFLQIVLDKRPLIDVRAPIEFEKGAIPGAVNLPLMTNTERHLVGICYKEKGNEAAVKLGHELVHGDIREARIASWKRYMQQHPDSYLYCFRGGLRSQISQQWLSEASGQEIIRLDGGYKAFRDFLLQSLEPDTQLSKPVLLGGCTGSGKTLLLKKLENAIDLEGLANHRGSSFGRHIEPQPTQANFENALAYALITHQQAGFTHMILEDEGRNIGKCVLPKPLVDFFASGDLVLMDVPFEDRVQLTFEEYVVAAQKQYANLSNIQEWADYIQLSLSRIKNRLGGDRTQQVMTLFQNAYSTQMYNGSLEQHKDWVAYLLKEYYDPMYLYQIEKSTHKAIFKGNTAEVLAYLKEMYGHKR